MRIDSDVDIDFADRDAALASIPHVDAFIMGKQGPSRHASGVYFQNVPTNPLNHNMCAFDYKEADRLGYFKVDFLNQSVYQQVRDEDHLLSLMREPDWDLLRDPAIVEKLPHIGNHFAVVEKLQPRSVMDLAEVLAILRPSKRYLVECSRDRIRREIWKPVADDGYMFKKAHAVAYAVLVLVQLNLILEGVDIDGDGLPT